MTWSLLGNESSDGLNNIENGAYRAPFFVMGLECDCSIGIILGVFKGCLKVYRDRWTTHTLQHFVALPAFKVDIEAP